MDPAKIAGVAEWPTPTNKKEVQSFLGFTNFYCWFIRDFSRHAHPLFDLTRNDVKWRWTMEEQSAFDALKSASDIDQYHVFQTQYKPLLDQ